MDKAFDCDGAVVPALLDDDDEEAESTVTVSDEVDMYFEERPINRKENLSVWWRSNSC